MKSKFRVRKLLTLLLVFTLICNFCAVGIVSATDPTVYTVTFVIPDQDPNVSAATGHKVFVNAGDAIGAANMPADPVVNDRVFQGWVSGGVAVTADTVPVKDMVVAAVLHAHTSEVIPAVAATCSATGLTEGSKCSSCGEILTAQTEVPMLAHTEEILPAKDATETETGLTEGKKCSVCGEILVAQQEIPMLDHIHTYGEGEVLAEPTCVDNGTVKFTCTDCGYSYEDTLPATGAHTESDLPEKAATCTEAGFTAGKKCSVCDEVLETQTEIPATGHTEEVFADKVPTCTEAGLTAGKKCSVCDEVLEAQTETPATGHTEEVLADKVPTCTEAGLTAGKKCSVCDEILEAQTEIPAVGHTYEDEWRYGTKEHYRVCTVCDEKADVSAHEPGDEATEDSAQFCTVCEYVITSPIGHLCQNHLTAVDATEPTCALEGIIAHYECDCGKMYADATAAVELTVDELIVKMTDDHEFDEWETVKEPTATEDGKKERVCKVCALAESETVKATGISAPVQNENVVTSPQTDDSAIFTLLAAAVSISGAALTLIFRRRFTA